jgi:hypothetical protein
MAHGRSDASLSQQQRKHKITLGRQDHRESSRDPREDAELCGEVRGDRPLVNMIEIEK